MYQSILKPLKPLSFTFNQWLELALGLATNYFELDGLLTLSVKV